MSDTTGSAWGNGGQGLAAGLMDPRIQSLLGLAGGLAQAAMPSRLPIPWGAALGMGAQGLDQGLQHSQELQRGALQLRQMQGLMSLAGGVPGGMSAPFGVPAPRQAGALNGAMPPQSTWPVSGTAQAQGGGPMPSPAGMAGGMSSPTPQTGVSPQGSVGGAATTPAREFQLAQLYAAYGQPDLAAAHLKIGQEMAGGEGYTAQANGTTLATSQGPKDVATIRADAAAQAAGGLPAKLAEQGYYLNIDGSIGVLPGAAAAHGVMAGTTAGATANAQLPADLVKQGKQLNANGSVSPLPGNQSILAGDAAATSAGTEAAKAPYADPVGFDAYDPATGGTRHYTVPRPAWAAGAGAAAPSGGATASGMMPAATFADRVTQGESGGLDKATNPGSSAAGPAQFLNGTWQAFMQSQHPELAQAASPQQLAGLKSDPGLAQEGTIWLAKQNANVLTANRQPVNAATLGLAHNLGGQGASDVLAAPAATPLSAIPSVAGAIGVNPGMQGMTAGAYRSNYLLRFGTRPVDLNGSTAPGGSSSPPMPGAIAGAPVMTPEQTAIGGAYGDAAKSVIANSASAPVRLQKLAVLQNATSDFRPGITGPARLAAAQRLNDAFQSVGIELPKSWSDNVAAGETIGKVGTGLGFDLAKSLGTREALGVVNMAIKINPNISMSEGGYGVIVNALKQQAQRDQDLGQFQEQFMRAHGTTAGAETAFDRQFPPEAYASRVMPFPLPADRSSWQPNVIYRLGDGSLAKRVNGGFQVAG